MVSNRFSRVTAEAAEEKNRNNTTYSITYPCNSLLDSVLDEWADRPTYPTVWTIQRINDSTNGRTGT